ncbi:hypothetical protein GJA_4120 [Janthinobacterium agaricidamnosum NBRC 102515 = DSM 9628]|uniref:Uncharacterized protein n=1 Tax=Janthinobacterium agaricidamnosum NBRC 102515 = DSM 9628 TaxID=1349767 RepID=W0VAT1_9BURK|nr:hypothetical protein GJA_4120 [Janthinobacterium agaricidamnosum NBRC 102515 = DSM 9628]
MIFVFMMPSSCTIVSIKSLSCPILNSTRHHAAPCPMPP